MFKIVGRIIAILLVGMTVAGATYVVGQLPAALTPAPSQTQPSSAGGPPRLQPRGNRAGSSGQFASPDGDPGRDRRAPSLSRGTFEVLTNMGTLALVIGIVFWGQRWRQRTRQDRRVTTSTR